MVTLTEIQNNGGTAHGGQDTAVLTIASDVEHAPPVVTAGAAATFTGGGSAVTVDSGLNVSDIDSGGNLTGATVTLSGGGLSTDLLSFNNGSNTETFSDGDKITAVYSSGVLTLSGTAQVADYQAALDQVQFSASPGSADPTGGGGDTTRTISWTVTDGSTNHGSATATSALDTVHVAPVVTAGNPSVTFTGGGSAVTLDSGLNVGDVDSGDVLTGATVSISSGYIAGDTLNFTAQNGITIASDNAGVLALTGSATIAQYQAALESVTYSFAANGDPTGGGGDTSRTVSWVLTDGSTSNGVSSTATSALTTVHVAPTVTAGGSATFDGGSSPVALDSALTVSDVDSTGNLTGATVSIGSGFIAGDVLNFTNTAKIIGSFNATTGVLSLSGSDTIADYQAALASIAYSFNPANGDPTNGGADTARTINWTVTDGSTSNGPSTVATSTVTVVHEPPTVTAGGSATFDGGGSPVTLDGALTVGDPDSSGNLTDATVTISSGFTAGDILNFTNTATIIGSYNATTGVLTLSGKDTLADYQAALASIAYSFNPANGDPTNGGADTARTINWTVNDGSSNGASAAATSALTVAHEPPTVTAGGSATFDGGGSPVTLDGALTVGDVDSGGNLDRRHGDDQLRLPRRGHVELHQHGHHHRQL